MDLVCTQVCIHVCRCCLSPHRHERECFAAMSAESSSNTSPIPSEVMALDHKTSHFILEGIPDPFNPSLPYRKSAAYVVLKYLKILCCGVKIKVYVNPYFFLHITSSWASQLARKCPKSLTYLGPPVSPRKSVIIKITAILQNF